jgi:hypothetical protein
MVHAITVRFGRFAYHKELQVNSQINMRSRQTIRHDDDDDDDDNNNNNNNNKDTVSLSVP